MAKINDNKQDYAQGAIGELIAEEYNRVGTDLNFLVQSSGQTPSDEDLSQYAKAVAQYSSNGAFYRQSADSTNTAYKLETINSKEGIYKLEEGLTVSFIPSFANGLSPTLDVNGLGAKPILNSSGLDIFAFEMQKNKVNTLVYNGAGWLLQDEKPIVNLETGFKEFAGSISNIGEDPLLQYTGLANGAEMRGNKAILWSLSNQYLNCGLMPTNMDNFKIQTRMKFYSYSSNVNGFGIFAFATNSVRPLLLRLNNAGKLRLWLSSNNSSWDIASDIEGTTTLDINKDYDIRLRHDKANNRYLVETSEDNEQTWVIQHEISTSLNLAWSSTNFVMGWNPFENIGMTGEIDLSKTYVSAGDNYETPIFKKSFNTLEKNLHLLNGAVRSEDDTTDLNINNLNYKGKSFIDKVTIDVDGNSGSYNQAIKAFEFSGVNGAITTKERINLIADSFEIRMGFSLSSLNRNHGLMGVNTDTVESFSVLMGDNNQLRTYMSSNSTSWDIANNQLGTKSDWEVDKKYLLRAKKEKGIGNIIISYSEDNGTTWIEDINIENATNQKLCGLALFDFAYHRHATDIPMHGKLYFEDCYIEVDDHVYLDNMTEENGYESFTPNTYTYLYAGLNDTDNVILERCENRDGSDLVNITSAKRILAHQKTDSYGFTQSSTISLDDTGIARTLWTDENILASGYVAGWNFLYIDAPRYVDAQVVLSMRIPGGNVGDRWTEGALGSYNEGAYGGGLGTVRSYGGTVQFINKDVFVNNFGNVKTYGATFIGYGWALYHKGVLLNEYLGV